jgi:hypothetical protein
MAKQLPKPASKAAPVMGFCKSGCDISNIEYNQVKRSEGKNSAKNSEPMTESQNSRKECSDRNTTSD